MHVLFLEQSLVCFGLSLIFLAARKSLRLGRQRTNNNISTRHSTSDRVLRSFAAVLLLLLAGSLRAYGKMPEQDLPSLPQVKMTQSARGANATVGEETVEITVCGESTIHIVAKPNARVTEGTRPWMLDSEHSCAGGAFTYSKTRNSSHSGPKFLK